MRGDRESIERHLEALRKSPLYHKTYTQLALHALDMAKKEKKLSAQKIKALRDLLEGK
jgi:hypothetical protein